MKNLDLYNWIRAVATQVDIGYLPENIFKEGQSFPRPPTSTPYITYDIVTRIDQTGIHPPQKRMVTLQDIVYETTSDYDVVVRVAAFNNDDMAFELLERLFNDTYIDTDVRLALGRWNSLVSAGNIESVTFLDDETQWLPKMIRDFRFYEKITTRRTFVNGLINQVTLEGDINDHEGNTEIEQSIVAP